MRIFSYILFLSCWVNMWSLTLGTFLSGWWNGNFQNNITLNIVIEFRDISHGMVLYAIDTNGNRLLIETGDLFHYNKIFICNFNGVTFDVLADEFFWISGYRIFLRFKSNNLYGRYKQAKLINIFETKPSFYTDGFQGYPIPRDFDKERNKTFFWLGNIGSYIGLNNSVYHPFVIQLTGCVGWFRVNDQEINIFKHGDTVLPSCYKHHMEKICNQRKCKIEKRISRILDCSLQSMNTWTHCFEDLSVQPARSFSRYSENKEPTIVKVAWKQEEVRNYCIMEIKSANKDSILIYSDTSKKVIIRIIRTRTADYKLQTLNTISLNLIHVLLLIFQYPNVIVKISSSSGDVKTYIEPYPEEPNLVNIGFSTKSKKCQPFDGSHAFRYNPVQFRSLTNNSTAQDTLSKTRNFYNKYSFHIFVFGLIVTSCLIIICISITSIVLYRRVEVSKKPIPDIYKGLAQLKGINPSQLNCVNTTISYTCDFSH